MQFKSIAGSILATLGTIGAVQATPVSAQLVPEPWVTVGTKDGSVSYGAGVKIFDIGAEIDLRRGYPVAAPVAWQKDHWLSAETAEA